jgi:hypothetical protein
MVSKRFTFLVVLSLVLFMAFSACSNKQVRYLASDVSLISPEITTKQEVLAILGQPDEQFEMVKVTFAGDIVRTSEYRSMSEEEYKQNGQTE